MRLVVALGGNALLPRGEAPDARPQADRVAAVARDLARLAQRHELVIVHGNGPQVGLLAEESSTDPSLHHPYPLDDLVAETQGLIGYWIQRSLRPHLWGPVVTLVTQAVVDPRDPAFARPTKYVGPTYTEDAAGALAARHGWTMAREGDGWRRVVPSPRPVRIVELELAGRLLERHTTLVIAGGGGIPVRETPDGFVGVEAVVDKDLAALEVAVGLDAERLVILTDVPHVVRDRGTDHERPLHDVHVEDLDETQYPAGSMGPKVRAVRSFVLRTGRSAAIGALHEAEAVVAGTAGTQVTA